MENKMKNLLSKICKNDNFMSFSTYKDEGGNECAGRFSCKEFTKTIKKEGCLDEEFFEEFIISIFDEMYKQLNKQKEEAENLKSKQTIKM